MMPQVERADQSNAEVVKKMIAGFRRRRFTVFPGPIWLKLLTSVTPNDFSELLDIQEPLISFIALQPAFLALMQSIDGCSPAEVIQKFQETVFLENIGSGLVHSILRKLINNHADMEQALIILRRAYLQYVSGKSSSVQPEQFKTMVTIATQSFNNEYVLYKTAEEVETCRSLFAGNEREVSDASLAAKFVAYAMYYPVNSLLLSEAQLQALSQYSEDVKGMIERQIGDAAIESKIAADIPTFSRIHNAVSTKVRQQYEESPYPRWTDLIVPKRRSFATYIKKKFPFLGDVRSAGILNCLVAGCGTGQQALKVASTYEDSSVVAVDLSRRSLAYGIRQAARYGITNIEFWHGDLLEIGALKRDFDFITVFGVLHHMENPAGGLRALTEMLRPGGFMEIAIYRQSYRDRLRPAAEFVRARLKSSANTDLQTVRHELISQNSIDIESATRLDDFYSSSGFRDLLCHVHETSFTPLGIKEMLLGFDLTFLGLDYSDDSSIKAAFLAEHPDQSVSHTLDIYEEFEAGRQKQLPSLIRFWVRKI